MGVSCSERCYNPKKTKGSKGVLTSLCGIKVKEPPFIFKNTFVQTAFWPKNLYLNETGKSCTFWSF